MKMKETSKEKFTYIPLVITSTDGKEIFALLEDGSIRADWNKLYQLKEKFQEMMAKKKVAQEKVEFTLGDLVGAALWYARNT